MKGCEWQPMAADDLDSVDAVARQTFPDHFEEPERFAERLALGQKYCAVLRWPDGAVCGYLLAYPSSSGKVTALNAPIQPSTGGADAVYISDLAILPEVRGSGVTHAVIERVVRLAREDGYKAITLVAVNDSTAFWARQGFQVQERPDLREALASYGDDACFMVRDLVPG